MHNFKELNVWKESKDFSINVYKITKTFPKLEQYGLTSQLNKLVDVKEITLQNLQQQAV